MVGLPSGPFGKQSPRPNIPRRLSNEWFSIITTMKFSIPGT